MSVLNIYRDDGFVAEQVLMRASVSLGRHPENDIVLDDRTLSRFHARVERRGDRYVVIDLGAQNGVYLNGSRITGESGLTPGDRIGLGRYVAIFDPQAAEGRQRRDEEGFDDDDRTGLVGGSGVDLDVDVDLDALLVEEAPQEATAPHGERPSRSSRASHRPSDELLDALDSEVDAPVVSDLDVEMDFDDDDDEGFDDPTTAVAKPPPHAPPVLVLLYNQLEVSRHPFDGDEMVVGRSKQCDVVISLLGLSRRHARLTREDGRIVVDDLGSQNGTWVNNVRIDGRRPLEHGDLMNFYEYGLLFLEDPSAEIQLPGVDFQAQAPDDALAVQETGQRGPPTLHPDTPPPGASPSSLPINDPVAPPVEGAGFDFDALGQGAFLEDAFDGATPSDVAPVADDLVDPEPTGAHDDISALSDAALLASLNLEADIDAYAGPGEYTAATGKNAAYDADKTAYSTVPRLGGEGVRGAWPSDGELEEALTRRGQRKLMSLEVYLDDDLYTQMPLSMDVTRVGTDARCEVALPSAAGLAGWQMTVVRFGATAILYRASSNARVMLDDVAIDQAVLRDGDVIQLGRLKIVFKCR